MVTGKQNIAYSRSYKGFNKYNNNPKKGIKLKRDKLVKILCCFVLLFKVAMAIGVIGHYNQITEMNREVVQHERKLAELKQEQEHLKLEIASLTTLKRIESIAVNELGMYHPWEEKEPGLVATTH